MTNYPGDKKHLQEESVRSGLSVVYSAHYDWEGVTPRTVLDAAVEHGTVVTSHLESGSKC